VLAAAIGRGYVGRHRLAEAALGRVPGSLAAEVPAVSHVPTENHATENLPEGAPSVAPAGRSVAPWLRVVPAPPQPDQLADTLPHPVVTLFPLAQDEPDGASPDESAGTAEEQVFSLVDAERERTATSALAGSADVRPYLPRHTA
jgi:hypothetical protein